MEIKRKPKAVVMSAMAKLARDIESNRVRNFSVGSSDSCIIGKLLLRLYRRTFWSFDRADFMSALRQVMPLLHLTNVQFGYLWSPSTDVASPKEIAGKLRFVLRQMREPKTKRAAR